MLKELQDIGLSEKEAKVYLSSLEIGRATADQLAKHSKIVRSTTYVQIESLMKKGLMSTYEEGKKTFFAPESPGLLKRLLEKQRDDIGAKERDLSSLLPDLLRQFEGAGERPVVRFFSGKEGIEVLREDILLNAKEKKLYVLSSNDAIGTVFSEQELEQYSQRRRGQGIHLKLLYTRGAGKLNEEPGPNAEWGFISADSLNVATDIIIFDDSVAIITLKGKLLGVLIKSQEIHDSMSSIFDFLWSQAKLH